MPKRSGAGHGVIQRDERLATAEGSCSDAAPSLRARRSIDGAIGYTDDMTGVVVKRRWPCRRGWVMLAGTPGSDAALRNVS